MSKYKLIMLLFAGWIILSGIISFGKLMVYYVNNQSSNIEWDPESRRKFETDMNSNLWLRNSYINVNGAIRNALGQHEMNNITKLNNGYLYLPSKSQTELSTLEDIARKTGDMSRNLSEQGIQYVLVIPPLGNDKYSDMLPIGIDDYKNDDLDNIHIFMESYGVEVIDLRDCLHEKGMTSYDIMFRTDHHWTTEGAFWAYNELMDYLNQTHDYSAADYVRDINNYHIESHPKLHLGSYGRRVGNYFAGRDDFSIILPEFDTWFENIDCDKTGTFDEMFIHREGIKNKNNIMWDAYNNIYSGAVGKIYNPNAPIRSNVIIMTDSFGQTLCPYLDMTFENVIEITSNAIYEKIEKYEPDIVLSVYNHGNLINTDSFKWPE